VVSAYEAPVERDTDFVGPTPGLLDIAEAFAIFHLLDGYLAGRIHYDKYTTATNDQSISVYDIQAAAREFLLLAEDKLKEVAMPMPAVTVK
jgi:hypothetical protein